MTSRDYNNIPKLLDDFDTILDRVAEKTGAYLESKLVERITKQGQWAPLAPKTILKKGSKKAWIDKGELRSLVTHVIEGRLPKVIRAGIFNHEKGMIAHFLEFGTENGIPERPLFRLVFDTEKDKIEKIVQQELNKELQRYLL